MLHEYGHAVIPDKIRDLLGWGNIIAARIIGLHLHVAINPKGENCAPGERIITGQPGFNRDGVFPRRKISVETLMRPDAGPTKLI